MSFINAIITGMGLQVGFFLGHLLLWVFGVVGIWIVWRLFIFRGF